jgi:hypothetical protein
MMARALSGLAMLVFISSVAVCADPPRLSAKQAIRLATAAAHKKHMDLGSHLPPKAIFFEKDRTWIIGWDERPDKNGMVTVGGDYTAVVEDLTGKVSFITGR